MKKFLFLIVLILSFMSCEIDVRDTVDNPKTFTTIQIQELPKDTVVIAIDNNNLYVFNKNNEVISVTKGVTDGYVIIDSIVLSILCICAVVLLIGIVALITSD